MNDGELSRKWLVAEKRRKPVFPRLPHSKQIWLLLEWQIGWDFSKKLNKEVLKKERYGKQEGRQMQWLGSKSQTSHTWEAVSWLGWVWSEGWEQMDPWKHKWQRTLLVRAWIWLEVCGDHTNSESSLFYWVPTRHQAWRHAMGFEYTDSAWRQLSDTIIPFLWMRKLRAKLEVICPRF